MLKVLLLLASILLYLPHNNEAHAKTSTTNTSEDVFSDYNKSNVGRVTGLPLPRFVSLKSQEVNFRSGPGYKYKIMFMFRCKGYPVEVVEEFEQWRMLKDINGNSGWIHENLISGVRNGIVVDNKESGVANKNNDKNEKIVLLLRLPNQASQPIARMEVGLVVKLKKCTNEWCKIILPNNMKGWLQKNNIWGVYTNETF